MLSSPPRRQATKTGWQGNGHLVVGDELKAAFDGIVTSARRAETPVATGVSPWWKTS